MSFFIGFIMGFVVSVFFMAYRSNEDKRTDTE
jgi:hypothetical protein